MLTSLHKKFDKRAQHAFAAGSVEFRKVCSWILTGVAPPAKMRNLHVDLIVNAMKRRDPT
jgi:hypothetical protein